MYIQNYFKKLENWVEKLEPPFNLSTRNHVESLIEDFKLESYMKNGFRAFSEVTWDPTVNFSGMMFSRIDSSHPIFGTTIASFEYKPYIIRGYPPTKNIENLKSIHNYDVAQIMYDGLQVSFFRLPNGMVLGKTKNLEYIERATTLNRNYFEIVKQIDIYDKICEMLEEFPNYVVIGELFGANEAVAGYIDYSEEFEYKAFDILDRTNHKFLHWNQSKEIFNKFDIPTVEIVTEDKFNEALTGNYAGLILKKYDEGEIYLQKINSSIMNNEINSLDHNEQGVKSKKFRVVLRRVFDEN